jgi:hypothetical protein
MTVKINADTTDGLKLVSDTSGTVDIQSNGTTKMSVTSSDITAPEGVNIKVHGSDTAGTQAGLWIRGLPRVTNDTSTFEHTYISSNNTLFFMKGSSATTSSNTEYARITSEGQMRFGTTGELNNSQVCIESHSTNPNGIEVRTDANNNAITFYSGSTTYAGAITLSGASTSYTSASDYRLKENVSYTWDATTRLKQLRPCRFNWIADDTDTALDGFLAHEVSTVVPDAVKGAKDATKTQNVYDNNGVKTGTQTVPDYQGIDQSKLVPLLVKTIQELEARITALENN